MTKMKKLTNLLIIVVLLTGLQGLAYGVNKSSTGTGNWNTAGTWTPSGVPAAGDVVTILSGHTVTVNVNTNNLASLTINSGGTLTVAGNTVTATSIAVNGTINRTGTAAITGTLVFNNGSTYQHAQDGGTIPTATWSAGSTCLVTGTLMTGPGGATQSFSNVTWNCGSMITNINNSFTSVSGTFTIINTGLAQYRFNSTTSTIAGNLVQQNGSTRVGSSTARTLIVGGNFSISGGTLTLSSGTAVGTLQVGGDFSMSGGTITETSTGAGAIVFNKAGAQVFTKSGGTISNTINFTVNSGSTLDMGTSILDGSAGSFTLSGGAALKTANTAGIASSGATGSVQVTGTRSFSTTAGYIYNGTAAQVTGTGLPASMTNLTIDNAAGVSLTNNTVYTVTGTLLINAGKVLNIGVGKKLTVSGTLTNNGGTAGLVIASDATGSGSLIHTTAGVSASVQRYITGYGSYAAAQQADHGWHFLSTPVLNQAFSPNFAPGTNDDLYMWDEPTDYWINYKGTSWAGGTSFINGIGYLVAYQATSTRTFTGQLNGNNPVTINGLTNNGTTMHHGWNLIGNPYPSAINWKKCTRANIDAIAKIWSEAGASYIDINTAGNGDTVAIGQGFMVHVTNSQPTGNVTIPVAAKTHNSPQYYKDELTDILKLTVYDPEFLTYQESNIIFNNVATSGYDPEFDSYFMAAYAPSLYSNIGDDTYLSTNSLPLMDGKADVNIGFVKNQGTLFTLEATGISTFPVGTIITLEDKKLNVTQDLTVNPLYAFHGEDGDDPGRFVIHINQPALGTGTIDQTIPYTIYNKGAEIFIQTLTQAGNYSLFISDMSGRKVFTDNIKGVQNYSVHSDLQTGIYIVTLTDGSTTYSKKLVITQ
jgi:hypothetical protein